MRIIDELIKFGEDGDELAFWSDIYDYLDANEQSEIFNNLKEELEIYKK